MTRGKPEVVRGWRDDSEREREQRGKERAGDRGKDRPRCAVHETFGGYFRISVVFNNFQCIAAMQGNLKREESM